MSRLKTPSLPHEGASLETAPSANTLGRTDVILLLLIFTVSMGIFSLNWRLAFSDIYMGTIGGESTLGALRVLEGEIPYRDFWTLYAPGHFYLLALFFKLFGTHLMVEVVAASVFCSLAVCALFFLVRLITRHPFPATVPAAVFFAALISSDHYYLHFETYAPTIFFIFLLLIFAVLFLEHQNIWYLVAAGTVDGLIVLNKHDVGAYTALAVGCGLLVNHFLNTKTSSLRAVVGQVAAFSAPMLAMVVPVIIYFARAAGADAWQDVVVFPTTDWRYSRPESYPSLVPQGVFGLSIESAEKLFDYVKFTVPFFLNALGLITLGIAIRRRMKLVASAAIVLWIAYWFHYMAAHLQVNTHIVTMTAYASATGAILYSVLGGWRERRRLGVLSMLLVCGWIATLVARPAFRWFQRQSVQTVRLQLPRVSGFLVTPEHARVLNTLVDFMDQKISSKHPLYIGLGRHDAIAANDMLIYFVLNRPIPVRYHDLHPAVADKPAAQREMIADIERHSLSHIILRPYFRDSSLDEMKADLQRNVPDAGATDLDQYIKTHYEQVSSFGPYNVLARRTHSVAAK